MPKLLLSGTRGPEVSDLQRLLNGRSPTRLPRLAVDGIFGPKTLARVREFQQQAGLKVDGVVGPLTLSALKTSPAPPGPPKRVCGNSFAGNGALALSIAQSFIEAMRRAAPPPQAAGATALSVSAPLRVADTAPPAGALFRRMSATQETRVKEVYGESIDFSTVFISNKAGLENRPFTICLERNDIPFSLVPGVGPNVKAIQIMNCGTFEPGDSTLIHEMAHVWQSQHHSNPKQYMKNCVDSQAQALATNGLIGLQDASVRNPAKEFPVQFPFSAYAYVPNKVFGDYAGEQVANAIELVDQIVRAHVRSVNKGAIDAENVRSLSQPKSEDRRKPRVRFETSDPVDLF